MTPKFILHAKINPKGEKEERTQKALEKIIEQFPFMKHCKIVMVSEEELKTAFTFNKWLNECAEWNHFN